MGRDKRNEGRSDHFAMLRRRTLETPAWRALTPKAMALYPLILLEWHGAKANNNGRLQLSVRQAADCLNIDKGTAQKAFHELQAKGFLAVTVAAHLGIEGEGQSPHFELTEHPLPGCPAGRRLFENWREGADFAVPRVMSNNPEGRNGRTARADNVVSMKAQNPVSKSRTPQPK